jgi:hypothetical protein
MKMLPAKITSELLVIPHPLGARSARAVIRLALPVTTAGSVLRALLQRCQGAVAAAKDLLCEFPDAVWHLAGCRGLLAKKGLQNGGRFLSPSDEVRHRTGRPRCHCHMFPLAV